MRSAVAGAAVLVAVAALAACYDNPTAPMRPRPLAPLMSVSGPMGAFSIPVPPLNDVVKHGAVADTSTGIYLPDNSTAVITVSGDITLALNSGYSSSGGAGSGADTSAVGKVAPPTGLVRNGVATHELMVTYHLSGQSFTPSLTPDSTDSTKYSFTYRTTQGGEILVGRSQLQGQQICAINPNPNIPSRCITPDGDVASYDVPSYKMIGVQTLSVERLDDDVTLTAVSSMGAKGRSVTFTAIPAAPGGGVWSWAWTPDSTPGQTVACSSAVNPCVTNVYEAGKMDVTYYVSSVGLARHATAHVTVVDCPIGDSLADQPAIRQALISALAASNPDSAAGSGFRHEEGGNIWRLPNGRYTTTRFADASPTECHVQPDISPVPPVLGASRVSLFHTHPALTGEDVYGCENDPNGIALAQVPGDGKPVPTAAPNSNGGGSNADWQIAGEQFDTYVINKDRNVYKLSVDNQPNPFDSNPDKWHIRTDTGCWQAIP